VCTYPDGAQQVGMARCRFLAAERPNPGHEKSDNTKKRTHILSFAYPRL